MLWPWNLSGVKRATWLEALRQWSRIRASAPPLPVGELPPPKATAYVWSDLRGVKRTKSAGRPKGERDWSTVTGITLHQTAVDFGDDPMRMLNVPAHGATLRDGRIVLLNSPTAYMWHGNSLNKTDIGIEVSCRACGIEKNPKTLWLPRKYDHLDAENRLSMADEATDVQLMATRRLVRYYIDTVAEHGGQIKYIHAHRQSNKRKPSDPGSRIWREVGQWAIEHHGLVPGDSPTWTSGGSPLPDVWTGENNGIRYSWKVSGF